MIWLAASLALFFVPSVLLSFRLVGKVDFSRLIVVFYLLVFSVNVIIFQVLSIVGRMSDRGFYLILQVIICLLVAFLCLWKSAPPSREQIRGLLHRIGAVETFLLACTIFILAGFFMVGITTAPNNTDSLNSHLLRIYYWLQHGSMASWAASWYPQIIYPVNAHLQGAWLFLLGRSENLFFLIQWFSLVTILSITYGIARQLGFSSVKSLTSSLVALSFPVIVLQTYSFQGDLTVTALVSSGIYFFLLFMDNGSRGTLVCALLSIALAGGTKQTSFLALPVIGGFVLFWVMRKKRHQLLVPIFAGFCAVFLIFSGFKYIQNQIETGSLLGNPKVTDVGSIVSKDVLVKFKFDMPRLFYDSISFEGLPKEIRKELIHQKATMFSRLDQRMGLGLETTNYLKSGFTDEEIFRYERIPDLSEDTSWFGPLSFWLLPLAGIFGLFSKNSKVRGYTAFALAFGFFYGIFVALQWPGWDPYEGRYFILGLTPMLPLVSGLIPDQRIWQRVIVFSIAGVVLILACNTLIFNTSKPILTYQNLQRFHVDRVAVLDDGNPIDTAIKRGLSAIVFQLMDNASDGQGILQSTRLAQLYYVNRDTFYDAAFILKSVPPQAAISILKPGFSLEFGLFGENMTRRLVPIKTLADYDGASYLVLPPGINLPADMKITLIARNDRYEIYSPANTQ